MQAEHRKWALCSQKVDICRAGHRIRVRLPLQGPPMGFLHLRDQVKRLHEEAPVWGFYSDPVVRIRYFHCHAPGSIPGQGTEIPQLMQHGKKKKKKMLSNKVAQSEIM